MSCEQENGVMSSVPFHQALGFYCPVDNNCFLTVLQHSYRFFRSPKLLPDPSLTPGLIRRLFALWDNQGGHHDILQNSDMGSHVARIGSCRSKFQPDWDCYDT